jgi:capsular exopolysaccharide synthesis family protein
MSRVHEAFLRARATAGGAEGQPTSPDPSGVPLFPLEGHDAASSWDSEINSAGHAVDPAPDDAGALAADIIVASQSEIPHEDSPVLEAPVPRLGEKLVLAPDPDPGSVEQYRLLAGRLHLAQAEHGIKVVMIASALPGEGKTLTAANLALTLSESYHRNVLVIDGDLRRPSIHELFRIQNVSGLNDGLRSDASRKVPLVRWSDHLTIITAGRPDADPMKVLVSEKMRKVITEAAAKFEWVIIDTPPVGLLTDASLFSAMVDTAVLVVQAGRTPYADIQRAVQALGKDQIFGVVLNRTDVSRQARYAGYKYKYGRALTSI